MLQIYVFFPVPQKKHIYEYRRELFRPGNGYVCMPYGVYHRLWAHQKKTAAGKTIYRLPS